MIDAATLLIFSGAVLMLMFSPGPTMAFVLVHGISLGWRGAVAAAVGIGMADLVLTLLTAAGVTALVTQLPYSLELLRYGGAIYLLWLARNAWHGQDKLLNQGPGQTGLRSVAQRAMLNSLLNPNAWLFFIVFLPQFADMGRGSMGLQLLVLGLILASIAVVFHSGLGAVGGSVATYLARYPAARRWHAGGLALVLLLLALRLVANPPSP